MRGQGLSPSGPHNGRQSPEDYEGASAGKIFQIFTPSVSSGRQPLELLRLGFPEGSLLHSVPLNPLSWRDQEVGWPIGGNSLNGRSSCGKGSGCVGQMFGGQSSRTGGKPSLVSRRSAGSDSLARGGLLGLVLLTLASGCATQKQSGKALQVVGTTAVVAGAITASQAGCSPVADSRYASLYAARYECRPRGSSQTAGAVVAAAGMGTAALGTALEDDANRLDAWKRSRSSPASPPSVLKNPRPSSSSLLALPEAPFTPRTRKASKQPEPTVPSRAGSAQ